MACFHPIVGYRSRRENARGRRAVTLKRSEGFADLPVRLPCGGCPGCLLERSRQWAVRCMHEASMHASNCFVTLTYDDAHLPELGSLDRTAVPLFMKRLRKAIAPERVRYFQCGEYGDIGGRPHYHLLLFGYDFPDRLQSRESAWRSEQLEKLWPAGRSEIGELTFESAAYVARYVMKKVRGHDSDWYYQGREPEFASMSRNPGIGASWYEKYAGEVYPFDEVIARGKPSKPPRYYDKLLEASDPELFDAVALRRRLKRRPADETEERLTVRELNLLARLELSGKRDF